MSQISKKKSAILIVLAVVVLLGICFATLSIYAKKELHKPRFKLPEEDVIKSASELPQDKEALCAYVNSLYANAQNADNVEGSWHTDINLEGDIVTPFRQADQAILDYIKDNAAGEVAALYPNESSVIMSQFKDAPVIRINPADIIDFTAEQGRTDEEGNVSEDGFYFISFTLNPLSVDTDAIIKSDIYKETVKKLTDVADITQSRFNCEEYSCSFKIDRITDEIVNVDVNKNYLIKSSVQLKPEFTGLLPVEQNSLVAGVELPYMTSQHISFRWYGCRFTQQSMVVNPGDMKALPADVRVLSEATKDDYKLTFTPSNKEAVSIDDDGVMTVSNNAVDTLVAPDEIVTISMKLEYDGKTYTDELKVYITELEVETDV